MHPHTVNTYQGLYMYLTSLLFQLDQIKDIRARGSVPYDKENSIDQAKLRELWALSQGNATGEDPGDNIQLVGDPRWRTIGFQGDDPSTDFRGAGMLGLDCLLYLGRNHGVVFSDLLKKSVDKNRGPYTFCCACFNVVMRIQAHFNIGNPDVKLMPLKLYASQASRHTLVNLLESEDAFEEIFVICLRMLDAIWAAECRRTGPDRLDLFNNAVDKMHVTMEAHMSTGPEDLEALISLFVESMPV